MTDGIVQRIERFPISGLTGGESRSGGRRAQMFVEIAAALPHLRGQWRGANGDCDASELQCVAEAGRAGPAGMFKPAEPGAVDHPAFPQLQNALLFDGLRHALSPTARAALDQAVSPQDWNLLFLSRPEFMY